MHIILEGNPYLTCVYFNVSCHNHDNKMHNADLILNLNHERLLLHSNYLNEYTDPVFISPVFKSSILRRLDSKEDLLTQHMEGISEFLLTHTNIYHQK